MRNLTIDAKVHKGVLIGLGGFRERGRRQRGGEGRSRWIISPTATRPELGAEAWASRADGVADGGMQRRLGVGGEAGRQQLQLGPPLARAGHLAGSPERGCPPPRSVPRPSFGRRLVRPHDAELIDDLTSQVRGDQLGVQPVIRDQIRKRAANRTREIRDHRTQQGGVGRLARSLDAGHQIRLGVGQQHRQLRTDEAGACLPSDSQLLGGGQDFNGPVHPARLLQSVHQGRVGVKFPGAAWHGPAQGGDAVIHLTQHVAGDLVGRSGQVGVAVARGQPATFDGEQPEEPSD